MMKTRTFLFATAVSASMFLASCDNEEDKDIQKPVITGLEVGHNDTIHVGEELHLDFYISDNDVFDRYCIVIHADGEHDYKSTTEHENWEFDSTFTEINGLRGTANDPLNVHHHKIVVPANAELGEYHFHLSVVDNSGNVGEEEKEIIIAEDDGDHGHDH